jgi:hypothetical protein
MAERTGRRSEKIRSEEVIRGEDCSKARQGRLRGRGIVCRRRFPVAHIWSDADADPKPGEWFSIGYLPDGANSRRKWAVGRRKRTRQKSNVEE